MSVHSNLKNKIASLFILPSLLISITACSSLPEPITGVGNTHAGYRSVDPCIRCGEGWQFLPNEEWGALKRQAKVFEEIEAQKAASMSKTESVQNTDSNQ